MRVNADQARVLIAIKTTPQPSKKYRDTVCTAGVRLDTASPQWIRLYPIPFRLLEPEFQYKKYDLIEVDIRRRTQDSRHESYQPDRDTMRAVGHFKPCAERVQAIRDLPRPSVCELQRGTLARHDGPSLGFAPVDDLDDLVIRANPGWSAQQNRRIESSREQVSLFDQDAIKRQTFSVLGVWWPRTLDSEAVPLF